MIDAARHRIWAWRHLGAIHDHYADAWETILSRPIAEIREALSEDSRDAADRRQGSPFAGVLSEPERRKILTEIR